ncbi:hypothetical protein DPMN_124988 [Dreissena polymorpha]|uniref:Heat shock 70 kDa protein 12A n=1 Tax=Dreissena polymorpha TaxID=45954 RepID=A0A9D4JUA4_DREPO|nr:hypothetical protein DPMN_124988 [Dreissena polymorpha]
MEVSRDGTKNAQLFWGNGSGVGVDSLWYLEKPYKQRSAQGDTSDPYAMASIDFGTTFSSWAYSFKHDFQQEPTKITARTWNSGTNISQKAPTALLIKPDGKTLDKFGYEAESKYAELAAEGEHKSWYFFRRFKMQLFKNKAVRKDLNIDDETGKPLDAITLFGLAIEFLKNDMMKNSGEKVVGHIEENDIKWVITVPAIWTEKSKQFMREAAKKAGIPNDRLVLALEPEAVSIYCRHLPVQKATAGSTSISAFKPGTCYLICDAGGGTIDITIHEVL